MTAKHRSKTYVRNARLIRQQVTAAHRLGDPVPCWRGRGAIAPGQAYDVGHRDPAGGEGLDNLAPEHRYKTSRCRGNRSAGGQLGALRTNQRRGPVPPAAPSRPAPGLLPW